MNFLKLEATGNDFVLIDEHENKALVVTPSRVRQLCDRHRGIGADGLILRKKAPGNRWMFFNNDGSEANFCGNAARAFCHYLLMRSHVEKVTFETRVGKISGYRSKKSKGSPITVEVPIENDGERDVDPQILALAKSRLLKPRIAWVNSGVPHLVLGLKQLPSLENRNLISRLLYLNKAAPKSKWNVTWLELGSRHAVTWERGLEMETLACGSGALACFLATEIWTKTKLSRRSFKFPGGTLGVKRLKKNLLSLTGETRIVFQGSSKGASIQ